MVRKMEGRVILAAVVFAAFTACSDNVKEHTAPAIHDRDSVSMMTSYGVNTLISDSGIIKYRIVTERWDVNIVRNPSRWTFEKGIFFEQFDEKFHVQAYIQADTAWYYDVKKLWHLRGRVRIRNINGLIYTSEELYWDGISHELYSNVFSKVVTPERQMEGSYFRSDEQMRHYLVSNSKGSFEREDMTGENKAEEQPQDPADTTKVEEYVRPATQKHRRGWLIVSMLASAFFSGMEIAFVSSNRLLAEMDKEKNGLAQKALNIFYQHPNNFVSTMLVGNNIALVIYGILFAKIFDETLFYPLSDGMRVTCDTLLSTLIVLFTGEFLPKSIFKNNPNTLLTVFAIPAYLFYVVLYPISRLATLLSKGLLRLIGIRMNKDVDGHEFTKVDLDYLVQSSIDNAARDEEIGEEVKIFQNALDFSETKVRDCMVPRTEIDAVEDTTTISGLQQMFVESGHSKIIVYHEDIDHITGYVHSSDMFRLTAAQSDATLNSLSSTLLRSISYVPESMLASKLMRMLMQQKRSLAVVVDEFGGTSGLVSLEDIMEEITGEIEDEHDNTNHVAKQISENEYVLSARLEIEKINEMFELDLPESDEYMTLGGLILHEYQSFPKLNEVVTIHGYEFKIIKNTATKIELVRLKVVE